MSTAFLAMNWKDRTTPQVRRYLAGASATQGVTFGALETGTGALDQCWARVQVVGTETFVACVNTKIHLSTDAGASWSDALSDANLGTNGCKAGPYMLYPGGVATLVVLARTSGSSFRIFTSTDFGATWASSGAITLVDHGNQPLQSVVQWNGSLHAIYWNLGGPPRTVSWDATSASSTTMAGSGQSVSAAYTMCVYRGRLFATFADGSGTTRGIQELAGGAWSILETFEASGATVPGSGQKWCMFVDPATDELVLYYWFSAAAGWRARKWNSSMVSANITTAVGANLLPLASTGRVACLADGQVSIGAQPTIFLYFAADGTGGTRFTVMQWNGQGAAPHALGQGGDVQDAMPFGGIVSGIRSWTSGQRYARLVSVTNNSQPGRMTASFRLYSSKGSEDLVGVYFLKPPAPTSPYPSLPKATLSNSSHGVLSGGNTITGLDADDNGATLFTVEVELQVDGWSQGQFMNAGLVIVIDGS